MRDPANKNLKQRPNGFWHFQRMKPADVRDRLGGGKFVQIALGTDSLIEARRKRDVINMQLDAEWAALRGDPADYLRAKELLPKREAIAGLPADPAMREMLVDMVRQQLHQMFAGIDAKAAQELLAAAPEDMADKFMEAHPAAVQATAKALKSAPAPAATAFVTEGAQKAALSKAGFAPEQVADAIKQVSGESAGSHDTKVSKAVESYLSREAVVFTSVHSPNQKKVFENQKRRSAARFVEVVGDLPVLEITRKDAQKFFDYWHARIYSPAAGEKKYSANSGSKEIGDMKLIWQAFADREQSDAKNPFDRLSFKAVRRRKLAYSREWVAAKWLQGDGLAGMNDELRRILLLLVETGSNPAEILRMPLERFRVDDKIPHLIVDHLGNEDDKRGRVKTDFRIRQVPLVGVALPAAKALAKSGGIQRYWDASGSFSAACNKYLNENDLQQVDRTVGCLRHSVIEALKNVGIEGDLRREIAGHSGGADVHSEHYGRYSLDRKRDALQCIALPFDPKIV